jgi:hypothetical protein
MARQEDRREEVAEKVSRVTEVCNGSEQLTCLSITVRNTH